MSDVPRVITHRCGSMTELLRYFDFFKEMGHDTYAMSDPIERTLGFMDATFAVEYILPLTYLKDMTEDQKSRFDSTLDPHEAWEKYFGSFDDCFVGFEEDDLAKHAAEDYDMTSVEDQIRAAADLWEYQGGKVETQKVDKVIEPIEPIGPGSQPRNKFSYVQPVSQDIGKDNPTGTGSKTKLRSYTDVESFAQKMREIQGAPQLIWDDSDPTGLRLKAIKTTKGILEVSQEVLLSAREAAALILQLDEHRKAVVMFEFNCDEPPGLGVWIDEWSVLTPEGGFVPRKFLPEFSDALELDDEDSEEDGFEEESEED